MDLAQIDDSSFAIIPERSERFAILDRKGATRFTSVRGRGPCETTGITSLVVLNRNLIVVDAALSRVQRWSGDGHCLQERTVATHRLGKSWVVDGKVVIRARRAVGATPTMLVLTDSLTVADEVRLDDRGPSGRDGLCDYCRTSVTTRGDVVSLTMNDSLFRVVIRSLYARGVRVIENSHIRPPVWTSSEKDSVRRFQLSLASRQTDPRLAEALRQAALRFELGPTKPLIYGLPVTAANSVFFPMSSPAGHPTSVLVLDSSTQTLRGSFALGPGCRLLSVTLPRVWQYCVLDDGQSRVVVSSLLGI
ncbi:hypothetical protein [Gemmatimonas sp.]|uniref:hypothetical protein n=1 Tax=Gemmatimonas sp. TaxID=1962908 RepID=UPI003342136F